MTGQIVIKSSLTAPSRRQPLLNGTPKPSSQPPPKKRSSTAKEVAGVTTANCFIVCCCCPCIILEFVILAVYKVPVSLCRRIWRKQRSKIKKRKISKQPQSAATELYYNTCCYFDEFNNFDQFKNFDQSVLEFIKVSAVDDDGVTSAVDLDNKMWDQFHGTGFWRSSSQRFS